MSVDGPRLVAVGASAGGIEALLELVAGLDPAMAAAVLVVVHQADRGPAVLADILDRASPSSVVRARHGARPVPGEVAVAPPDVHLRVDAGRVVLGREGREGGHRPGIDPLFRSVAGPGTVGVVLSGMLDDGAAGLAEVVRLGGAAVVQDPGEALYRSMPDAALARVPDALVRRARDIGPTLAGLVGSGGCDGGDGGDGTDRSDAR